METDRDSRIVRYAVLQSITETGIGSLVHGFHIPLGGHFLSLNQGVLLTLSLRKSRATRSGAVVITGSISMVAAAMKLLSPLGKRLPPAIAIATQGFLFSVAIGIFGASLLGVILGSALLSVWAFLHPLIFTYLIFGESFFSGVKALWIDLATKLGWEAETGVSILLALVLLKMGIAVVLAVVAWRASPERESNYAAWLKRAPGVRPLAPEKRPVSPAIGAFRDLLRPAFLATLVISAGFVILSARSREQSLLYLVKSVGIAWLLFYAVRVFPTRWSEKIKDRFPVLRSALEEVRREGGPVPESTPRKY